MLILNHCYLWKMNYSRLWKRFWVVHSCVICVLFVSATKSCWKRRCWSVIFSFVANASHDVSIFLFRIQWKKRISRRLSAVLDNARLLSALSKGSTLTPKLTAHWSGLLRLTCKRKSQAQGKHHLYHMCHHNHLKLVLASMCQVVIFFIFYLFFCKFQYT